MQQAFDGVLNLFAYFLVSLNDIEWIFGYSFLEWLVACSLLILIYRLVMMFMGHSLGVTSGLARSVFAKKRMTSMRSQGMNKAEFAKQVGSNIKLLK